MQISFGPIPLARRRPDGEVPGETGGLILTGWEWLAFE